MFDSLTGFDYESEDSLTSTFLPLCSKVSSIIKQSTTPSINTIVQSLLEDGSISAGDGYENLDSAASLVFAIIGWLTMLYRPDVLSCPSTEFCIADEMDGHHSGSHMSLKQDRIGSSKRLSDFLLGFGLMLPPANYHILEDAEEIKLYDKLKSVEPSTLNLFLLTTIGGVSVEWTDSLACHLELDKDARLIYMFRYPSFCWSNLHDAEAESSTIHACASDVPDNHHWGTKQDVTQLLEEILLSYRLLIGQNIRSRRLFQKLSPFQGMPANFRDDLLVQLCTSKDSVPLGLVQRDAYELARDFPHLRTRLVRLDHHLNQRKPRSWTELWLDNRDSASWLTFWAVIIIGGIGLLLALIQVILQIVQIAFQIQHPNS
jgi:hypothetical protein